MSAGNLVLLVEDEEQIQKVLLLTLQLQGYSAVTARTGSEALEHLARHEEIRLVLMDYSLPDMNGLALATRIGEMTGNRIPVIAISGNVDLADMAFPPCVVAKAPKPFHFGELLQQIRRYCGEPAKREAPLEESGRCL